MHPTEFWWMYDARRPVKKYGSMTEPEMAELHEQLKGWGYL